MLEGFLARLAASPNAEDFVLTGGVLMAAFAVRRPTRDIDPAALGFVNEVAEVERRIRGVLASPVEDGLSFDLESVSAEEIREDAAYSGVRVRREGAPHPRQPRRLSGDGPAYHRRDLRRDDLRVANVREGEAEIAAELATFEQDALDADQAVTMA